MNKFIIHGITFIFGGALGALVAHVVTRNKMLNELQEKLDTMHEYYEAEYGHLDIPEELLEVDEPKEKDESKTQEIINATRSQDPIVRQPDISEYVDYTQYYGKGIDPAETESPTEDDAPVDEEAQELARQGEWLTRDIKEERAKNSGRLPKIIKEEECGSDPAYRVVCLTYCTEDGALVEDQGDVFYDTNDLDEVGDLIGDALDKYGFRHNDESSIHVRNYSYGIDYDISKFDGSYKDLVGEGV